MKRQDTYYNLTTPLASGWRNNSRHISKLKLMACALLLWNTAGAQTITVDGNPSDWPAVLSSNSVPIKVYKADAVNSHSDDKWTMGSQPVDPVSGWHWKEGNVNDKEDMRNTGVAVIGRNLYFFADLYANNGDASIGLWLLKGGVDNMPDGTFSGAHVEGDLLVSLAFTNGHATATPTIYRWTSGALTLVNVGPTVAGAATNSDAIASPWPYTPKQGTAGTYPANSFFEGFINLDSVQGSYMPCFATALFQTWESQSPHAALSDLVLLTPVQVRCGCGCPRGKASPLATIPLVSEFSIYPSPSDGTFELNVPTLASDAVAVVSDLYGRVLDKRVISKSDNGQQLNYNLGSLSAGVYFIRVDNNDIHYSDKLLMK